MKLVVKRLIKEGKVDEVIKMYQELVAQTRKEEGCIVYELCRDAGNPRLLAVIEEWENDDVVKKHQQSPHFTKLIPLVNDLTETRTVETYQKLI